MASGDRSCSVEILEEDALPSQGEANEAASDTKDVFDPKEMEEIKAGDAAKDVSDPKEAFKLSHRAVSKNWHLPKKFPSKEVVAAYMKPSVDSNKDKFDFRKPDLDLLREYCRQRFGWSEV
jgi:hypothetical protein